MGNFGNVFLYLQVSPAFLKFELCHFAVTKDLHWYLFSLYAVLDYERKVS